MRAAVGQPVAKRLEPEQPRERHTDGPQLEDGEVGDRVLRGLRQHERHAVPCLDAEGPEPPGQPVREALEIVERVGRAHLALALPDQGAAAVPSAWRSQMSWAIL